MCDQSVAVIDPRREYYRNYTDSHALCFEDLKQKVGGGGITTLIVFLESEISLAF